MFEKLQVVERAAHEAPIVDARIGEVVTAHLRCKLKFKAAVYAGKVDVSVETKRRCRSCPFQRWLDDAAEKEAPERTEVGKRHAQFQIQAALVAELALAGRREEARKALDAASAFGLASHSLLDMLWGMV